MDVRDDEVLTPAVVAAETTQTLYQDQPLLVLAATAYVTTLNAAD